MMGITPKPWTAIVEDSKNLASFAVRAGTVRLAAVWTKRGSYHPTIETIREGRANALLMAAAPDLRDALARLVKTVEKWDDDALIAPLLEARRAMAKASTGEPIEGWPQVDEEALDT